MDLYSHADCDSFSVSDSVSVYVSPKGDIKEKNTKKENPLDESEPPGEGITVSNKSFDEFWSMYPKHNAKKAAMMAWQTATIGTDPKIIMAGLKKVLDRQWSRWPKSKQEQFIPNAVNWLKGERWKDDVPVYQSPKASNQKVKLPGWADYKPLTDEQFLKMLEDKDNGNQ